jgi:hypothetical protein
MTEAIEPEWLKGFVPTPAPEGHRWKKGQSGNPKGRPPGRPDARTKITRALMDEGLEIARVVTEAAKEGDLQACSIVLARIAPTLKAQSERVAFDFDATASVPQQIEAVLTAIAAGALAPDVGREIIAALGTLSDARAVADLEARIITLEAKQI